jgi:hypothetical protein
MGVVTQDLLLGVVGVHAHMFAAWRKVALHIAQLYSLCPP